MEEGFKVFKTSDKFIHIHILFIFFHKNPKGPRDELYVMVTEIETVVH